MKEWEKEYFADLTHEQKIERARLQEIDALIADLDGREIRNLEAALQTHGQIDEINDLDTHDLSDILCIYEREKTHKRYGAMNRAVIFWSGKVPDCDV
jgi:hypothetical protein